MESRSKTDVVDGAVCASEKEELEAGSVEAGDRVADVLHLPVASGAVPDADTSARRVERNQLRADEEELVHVAHPSSRGAACALHDVRVQCRRRWLLLVLQLLLLLRGEHECAHRRGGRVDAEGADLACTWLATSRLLAYPPEAHQVPTGHRDQFAVRHCSRPGAEVRRGPAGPSTSASTTSASSCKGVHGRRAETGHLSSAQRAEAQRIQRR